MPASSALVIKTARPSAARVVRAQMLARPAESPQRLMEACPDYDHRSSRFASLHAAWGAHLFYDGSALVGTANGLRCVHQDWAGEDGHAAHFREGCWQWSRHDEEGAVLCLGQGPAHPPSLAEGIWHDLAARDRLQTLALPTSLVPRRVDREATVLAAQTPGIDTYTIFLDDGSYLAYTDTGWEHGRRTMLLCPGLIADWVGDRSGFYWALLHVPVGTSSQDLEQALCALRAEPLRGIIVTMTWDVHRVSEQEEYDA